MNPPPSAGRAERLTRHRADLHRRWRRGERPTVEAYRDLDPELADDADGLLGLIEVEILFREARGESFSLGEYQRRFPLLDEPLRRLFAWLSGAADEETIAPPAAPDSATTLPPPTVTPGEAPPISDRVGVPGYEILGELGRGGMGVVYKARHAALKRTVALKMVLSGEHAGSADLVRFRTEAEASARMQHPNVVQIFEVGDHAGRPFFSLEFCEGGSLAGRIDGRPWDGLEAATLVEVLARAVHAAHRAGIVHRDLKPANVLLTADGTPKVTDFGLAKRLEEGKGLTQTGAVMGTPSYMAPEQAAGKAQEIGPPADVYALGAILYELVTGRPPFQAATSLDTVLQVLSDDPTPPRVRNRKVPRDLETICLKCLSKEPKRRYASAEELADDLRRFQDGDTIRARRPGEWEQLWKWTLRNPVSAVTLLLCLIGAFLLGCSLRSVFPSPS